MKILVVIDMQNDFIDGALGTKEAQAIVPKVAEKIKNFDGKVFYTRDTHDEKYLETQEGKNLLVKHCIRGTDGWKLTPEIDVLCEGDILNKSSFGSIELGFKLNDYRSNLRVIKNERVESITLIGVCTDICVISNAMILKAFFPDKPIIVDAACCAGSTPEGHKNALAVMKTCQIQIENEDVYKRQTEKSSSLRDRDFHSYSRITSNMTSIRFLIQLCLEMRDCTRL